MTLRELAELLITPTADIGIAARFRAYMLDTCGIDVNKVADGLRAFLRDVNKK